jgi:hypothetical protein
LLVIDGMRVGMEDVRSVLNGARRRICIITNATRRPDRAQSKIVRGLYMCCDQLNPAYMVSGEIDDGRL